MQVFLLLTFIFLEETELLPYFESSGFCSVLLMYFYYFSKINEGREFNLAIDSESIYINNQWNFKDGILESDFVALSNFAYLILL